MAITVQAWSIRKCQTTCSLRSHVPIVALLEHFADGSVTETFNFKGDNHKKLDIFTTGDVIALSQYLTVVTEL